MPQGDHRHLESIAEIPPRPVREIAAETVWGIDNAIARLTAWGIRCPPDSRLHKARAILEAAAATGVLAPLHRRDLLGLRALETAFDYVAIAETLPDRRVASMRRELRDSLVGEIDPPESARGPLQLQSQALVRAAFVRAGLSPLHPTQSPRQGRSSPDLLLENGLSVYGVEAKRPQAAQNIVPRFLDGCSQLADFGVCGAVLVDVSDCLRDKDDDARATFVYDVGGGLATEVFQSGVGHRPEFDHLMVVGAYARVAWSSEDRRDHAMVKVQLLSRITVLAQARNTLRDHRAKWIRSSFSTGLRSLTDILGTTGGAA